MEKFTELLNAMKAKEALDASDVSRVQGAFAMLSDDEQAEVKEEVDGLEVTEVEEEVVEEEVVEEVVEDKTLSTATEAEVRLAQAEAKIQTMELAQRTEKLDASLDSLIKDGRILGKSKDKLKDQLLSLSVDQEQAMLSVLSEASKVVPVGAKLGLDSNEAKDVPKSQYDLSRFQTEAKERFKLDSSKSLGSHLFDVAKENGVYDNIK